MAAPISNGKQAGRSKVLANSQTRHMNMASQHSIFVLEHKHFKAKLLKQVCVLITNLSFGWLGHCIAVVVCLGLSMAPRA